MGQKPIFIISLIVILLGSIFTLLRSFEIGDSNFERVYQEKEGKCDLNGIEHGDMKSVVSYPGSQINRTKSTNLDTYPFNSVKHDKSSMNNSYDEEFTIILLTQGKRPTLLIGILEHLNELPGLRRVLIIWNGEKSPVSSLKWPIVNFPYQVLTNGKNSLNNRFLPLKVIDTDAVLSIDDDTYPSRERLLFAFRVWLEFRDRIVGFFGRGVIWSGNRWKYDLHPCFISIVITGYAFFHKKYLNLYTYEMPEVIRERVDNFTNCEDIAMNFMVSNLTKKTPIKLTQTSQSLCPKCNKKEIWKHALSKHSTHLKERDDCVNFFTEVYGYMPLLKSEYRIDIVDNVNPICRRTKI